LRPRPRLRCLRLRPGLRCLRLRPGLRGLGLGLGLRGLRLRFWLRGLGRLVHAPQYRGVPIFTARPIFGTVCGPAASIFAA
jgi:hypothetical protein